MFCKKDDLRNFTEFTGKHQCQSLFFNKVAGLRPATLLKKRLLVQLFSVNFAKFLRTPFYKMHLLWLLLKGLKFDSLPFLLWLYRALITRGLRPATLLKKRPWNRCFPVNFAKFLRTPFFLEHLWWQVVSVITKQIIFLYIIIFLYFITLISKNKSITDAHT